MDIGMIIIYSTMTAIVIYAIISTYNSYNKSQALTADPYYSKVGIKKEQLILYQHYITKILSLPSYNGARIIADISDKDHQQTIDLLEDAVAENLNGDALIIMVYQYMYADTQDREIYTKDWVDKVLHRSNTDFFPDPKGIEYYLSS